MLPRDVRDAAVADGALPAPTDADAAVERLAAWLLSPAARRLPPVRRYLFYLKWMYETFHAVAELFPSDNVGRDGRLDAHAMATSPEEMLHLANYLYVLDSHGVAGAVLECGCFKGFSTCCLSHACAALARRLHVADSFAGLPAPGPEERAYAPGDFRGTLAEVEANVRACGRPAQVTYRPGWFAESLPGWREPLALLWIDVDLYRSTRDVLDGVFPALDPRGAIFSHELLPAHIQEGGIVHGGEPPGALHDFFAERGLAYRAAHAVGWTGVVTFAGNPARGAERLLAALLGHLRDSDHRARAARQALGLKSALRDLGRRGRSAIFGRSKETRGPDA
jgi:O-methyltransferase